jgi:small subunit ribosomal protein S2
LDKTIIYLRIAAAVTEEIAKRGGMILFVGTREPLRRLVYESAMEANSFYVNQRWIGGTLTNAEQVLGKGMAYAGGLTSLSKTPLKPDLVILLEPNPKVLLEAENSLVPTIAICDTNGDPTKITYPIPSNDDAFASVEFISRVLARSAAEGHSIKELSTEKKNLSEKKKKEAIESIIESGMSFIENTNLRKEEFSLI